MQKLALQKKVEKRIVELADENAKYLGMSRRQFLQTSCGMATCFLAMNEIYGGGVFQVSKAEARDPEMQLERTAAVSGQFIFDDQTHFLRDDFPHEGILGLGEFAAEHWNPVLKEEGISLTRYKFENYIRELWFNADTKMSLLSGAPFDDPTWYLLFNDQIMDACDTVNDFAGGIEKAITQTHKYLIVNKLQLKIEIETRNLEEVNEVLRVGKVDRIMLDNFSYEDMRKAVELINGKYETEASGGINLETVRNYAECGVDFVSVGALTHSVNNMDLSLKAF